VDTRDYVIVGVLVALIVWFFCRRRSSCGCNTQTPVVGNQGSGIRSGGGCGPFACGSVRDNMTAPLAQPLQRI
jgi:hypothetical protein